jgi:adenylate kinase family enzyme
VKNKMAIITKLIRLKKVTKKKHNSFLNDQREYAKCVNWATLALESNPRLSSAHSPFKLKSAIANEAIRHAKKARSDHKKGKENVTFRRPFLYNTLEMEGCPMNILILGKPGSGKSSLANALSQHLCLPCLSPDGLLKTALSEPTKAMIQEKGDVPDWLGTHLILSSLRDVDGFILDGHPATLRQWQVLRQEWSKTGTVLDAVFHLRIGDETAKKRAKDPHIEKRLRQYRTHTHPVVESLKEHPRFHGINGSLRLDTVISRAQKFFLT